MALLIDGVLSEARLRAEAGETSYERGLEYADSVRGLRVARGEAHGAVHGTHRYNVTLRWSSGELDGECTCPHADGGNFCKHQVALGLVVLGEARPAETRAPEPSPVEAYLRTLDADALRGLVLEAAAFSEGAVRMLEVRAAMTSGDHGAVAGELTAAVTTSLRTGGFVDWREASAVAYDARQVLDELETHLDSGQPDVVRPALLKAMTRLRKILLHADDSSGVIGEEGQRAADLYARSCREGSPDPTKLARWLVKFRVDSPGWPDVELADFVEAFDDKALAAYRRAVMTADAKHAGESHWNRFELDRMLLELADHDGDVDRAVELLSRDGERVAFGAIVGRLQKAGRDREAMAYVDRAVAEGRVTTAKGNEFWLGTNDLARLYLAHGRDEDAVQMLRSQFERQPTETAYALLLDVGRDTNSLEEQRSWAIEQARAKAAARNGSGGVLIEMALHDDDLERAWEAADAFGPGHQWQALARASWTSFPVRAADLYRPSLSQALQRPNTKAYPGIAQTLVRMRGLYDEAGRREDFDVEIRELREEYSRRPALLKAMDLAGLPGSTLVD